MNRTMDSPAAECTCREILDPADPLLPAMRALYESTLDEDERIPWHWLARTPEWRANWRPGERRPHLVVATSPSDPNRPTGFGYGAFLPGFGGYVCYLGVDPRSRGRGTGTQLFRYLFQLIESAARISALPLPVIVWESHRTPDPELWATRLRLFDRIGGQWIRGIELLTPNYMKADAEPVRLQVYVRPWDEPAARFNAERLRGVVGSLYDQVYHISPDDTLRRTTLEGAVNPQLVPAVDALEV